MGGRLKKNTAPWVACELERRVSKKKQANARVRTTDGKGGAWGGPAKKDHGAVGSVCRLGRL